MHHQSRGPLPTIFTMAITSLRMHASGLQQKLPSQRNSYGQNLPSYFEFDLCAPAGLLHPSIVLEATAE